MTRLEDQIRDYLADHLSVLENGLCLINKEFVLKNSDGSDGRIDILAQDEFGNYVIIEIKRSDQAARQALHELFKYTSIIHRQLGVSEQKIRAMLVSTTWHELAVPFSEYLNSTPFHTEGYYISIDARGVITSCEPFIPISLKAPLDISRSQGIYLYEDETERQRNVEHLCRCLQRISIQDHVLIFVDYSGQKSEIVYPYGIYVVFSSPFHVLDPEQQNSLKAEIGWEDGLDEPDENFLVALSEKFDSYNSFEIGYPEKLKSMAEEWSLRVAIRSGRLNDNANLFTDKAIISDAMKIESGSDHYLYCIISPRFSERWSKGIEDLDIVCAGNRQWASTIKLILQEIKERDNRASVSIAIYNPADTYFALAKLAIGDFRYFSGFQIISKECTGVREFLSQSVWNRQPINLSPSELMSGTCGTLDDWLLARHFGAQSSFDDDVRKAIGIATPILETWTSCQGEIAHHEVLLQDCLIRCEIAEGMFLGLDEMFASNQKFFEEYLDLIAGKTIGLVN